MTERTFIDLVRMVARESGTVAGDLPQTVSGQSGRVGKIIAWVSLAWTQIQNMHSSWRWMHGEFEADIEPGMFQYSPLQMGIDRFARWGTLPYTMSLYDPTLGKSDEGFIVPIEYWRFRRSYDIGEHEPSRPHCFAISPLNLLCFGPTPDQVYHVRGEYFKSPQALINDDDVPELPERFRPIIGWLALTLLAQHDEAGFTVATAQQNYREYLSSLEFDQLPNVTLFTKLT